MGKLMGYRVRAAWPLASELLPLVFWEAMKTCARGRDSCGWVDLYTCTPVLTQLVGACILLHTCPCTHNPLLVCGPSTGVMAHNQFCPHDRPPYLLWLGS